jgi:hypothetical protein
MWRVVHIRLAQFGVSSHVGSGGVRGDSSKTSETPPLFDTHLM